MKHCKFNTSFRESVAVIADALDLEFVSTSRQVENGTLVFYDPETDSQYAMYESGYVRRHIRAMNWGEGPDWMIYQLNRIKKVSVKYRSKKGKMKSYVGTERILANPDEQLAIFVRAVIKYRKDK